MEIEVEMEMCKFFLVDRGSSLSRASLLAIFHVCMRKVVVDMKLCVHA